MKIYNSLTKQKESFTPLEPGKLKIYVCGMTVYDYCHLGHARAHICFDVMIRYFRSKGIDVHHVRNITDIDDKIINRANELGEEYKTLTERFIKAMHEDFKALNMLTPDSEPRATEYIPQMIALIEQLIEKGYAYLAENGDVFFEVSAFENYGALAHRDMEGQEVGARVDVLDVKRHPLDFALWKSAKPDEPSWSSPWGEGRPGWHIECSAMSMACFGEQMDIHGGGFDLQFPHHENEIAQSEAATGKRFANYWMHVGFLQIDKAKMSKSLGNFFTIREVLKQYHPEVVRYFLLSSHYRSQLNYSQDNLEQAAKSLERLYTSLRGLALLPESGGEHYEQRFDGAMEDDFNVPDALAVLFEVSHGINKLRNDSPLAAGALGTLLRRLGETLGILQGTPDEFLKAGVEEDEQKQIEALIADREKARSEKDWARADELRNELKALGVEIEDGPSGTTWKKL